MTSPMVPWPTTEQYEAAWKGRERDLTQYYQDAAFAAIPRLRRAVSDLQRIAHAQADGLDGARDTLVLERAINIARKALLAIGPLPNDDAKGAG